MRLAICLILAACGSNTNDPIDAGPTASVVPETGAWDYDEVTPVSSTCPGNLQQGGTGAFAIDRASSTSFHVVPNDGTAAFTCTLDGGAFDCADRLTNTQDLRPAIDAVVTAHATARGTFSSGTRATGRQEANVTCVGTQCNAAFPCNVKVDFSIRAR